MGMNNRGQQWLKFTNYETEVGLKRLKLTIALAERLQKKFSRILKILDVGCGTGNMSIPLASLGHRVLGIDIDRPTIARAKELNPFKNASFIVSTIDDISKTRKFDLIICCEIIEHLHDPNSFLTSIVSHLTKSGNLIISIPNGYGPYEIIELIKHGWIRVFRRKKLGNIVDRIFYQYLISYHEKIAIRHDIESPHLTHYTLSQFKELISTRGLKIASLINTNYISGIFPLHLIPGRTFPIKNKFDYWDCIFSERIPSSMASGWYFELIKINK